MERLTRRSDTGHAYYPRCFEEPCNRRCEDCLFDEAICKRLAAYEDTGREPEEIDMDHEAAETLRQLCRGCDLDRLEELVEADKGGRLVVLPVKPVLTPIISSVLYIIEDGVIYEDALYEAVVGMSESGKVNVVYTTLSDQIIFEQADIGKTVFLTREEAEKALEAMREEGAT